MKSETQREHQWLQKLAGEWTCNGEATAGHNQSAEKWKTTESVRSLGGVWFLCEGRGEARKGVPSGAPSTTMMTLGYDAQKQCYVGTFAGSMMSHLWVYEGRLDEDGVLTLNTEGPDVSAEGKMSRYRDVIAFSSDDARSLNSYILEDDGQWRQIMAAQYQRTGSSGTQ